MTKDFEVLVVPAPGFTVEGGARYGVSMVPEEMIGYLKKVPLFEGLPRHHLEELAGIAVVQGLGQGEQIFFDGDEARGLYVVVSGRVKVFKLSFEGKEQILHVFGPGEPFGEAAVFAGRHFPAHAQAMEGGKVLFFPKDAFVELIRRHPTLSLDMLAVLSLRLRKFTHLVEDLSLKEVPGRLAAYLLYLRERAGGGSSFDLDISKGQLAGLLGTVPETISRIFAKMNRQGIIRSQGARIHVLDPERLRRLSEGEERLP